MAHVKKATTVATATTITAAIATTTAATATAHLERQISGKGSTTAFYKWQSKLVTAKLVLATTLTAVTKLR